MLRQTLMALLVGTAAGCGSGRLLTSDSPPPAPASGDAGPQLSDPAPVSSPSPTAGPAPEIDAAPLPTPSTGAYAPYGGQTLQIRRIGQWSSSGITTATRLVIRDEVAYASFWAGLGGGERPSVDFSRDVVIAVASGQRATGGHSIAVERVTRSGAGLAVEVVETVPGPGCVTTHALTQPVDVIVVEAANVRTWSFSDQSRPQACQ